MTNQKISQLVESAGLNDTDDLLLRVGADNLRVPLSTFRRLLSLQPDPWVLAALGPATPEGQVGASFTSGSLSPLPPLPGGPNYYFSMVNSGPCPVAQSGVRSGSFNIPTYQTGTDNPFLSFIVLANSQVPLLDLVGFLNGGLPTPETYGVFGIWISNFSALAVFAITPSGGVSIGTLPVSQGAKVYMDYNPTTGEVTFTDGVGSLTAPFDWSQLPPGGELQVIAGMAFNVDTPVFTAGQMAFSMSDGTGSRDGFEQHAEASAPVGAMDGKRYVVQGSGAFAGRDLLDGDLVEFHSGVTGVFVTRAEDPVPPPPPPPPTPFELSTFQKALMLRKSYGIVQDPSALVSPEEGAMAVVATTKGGDFAAFPDWSVAVFNGVSWTNYPAEDFAKVRFSVDSPDFPQGRTIFYTGGAPEDQLPGVSSFMGVNSLPFPTTAPADYFGNAQNVGWIVLEPNLSGLGSDWNQYPFTPVYDGWDLKVGGTPVRAYALTGGGDVSVTVLQDQNLSGAFGSSPEFNAVVGVFDIFNDSSLPATICFEGPGSNGKKFTFHPAEARRFLVMKTPNTLGRVGLTVTPLNRPQERVADLTIGWTPSTTDFGPPLLHRDGDVVTLNGCVEREPAGGFVMDNIPEEYRPRKNKAFPVSVLDSVAGWITLTGLVDPSGILEVYPDNSTTVRVVFNTTWPR